MAKGPEGPGLGEGRGERDPAWREAKNARERERESERERERARESEQASEPE